MDMRNTEQVIDTMPGSFGIFIRERDNITMLVLLLSIFIIYPINAKDNHLSTLPFDNVIWW